MEAFFIAQRRLSYRSFAARLFGSEADLGRSTRQVTKALTDNLVAKWQGRFRPMRHHAIGDDNRAPPSIWRAINGCRTSSGRDRIHVPDRDAAPLVRLRACPHLPHAHRAGADIRDEVLLVVRGQRVTRGRNIGDIGINRRCLHGRSRIWC